MGGLPKPTPSIFDRFRVVSVEDNRKVYKDDDNGLYYTWDTLHGEAEVFNKRGVHLGVVDPITGLAIKPAVKGRKIRKQN